MSTKVLVIGLDGATFEVIRPLAQTGYVPNLARLMTEGTSGELLSTMPPVSGPAWHAFKTGKNPGRTGVYDFLKYDPQRYRSDLIQIGQISDLKLWDVVSRYSDYHVGVYNLPTTYPPSELNGFMVAGFPLPDDAVDYTYPLELKSELDGLTGNHRTDISYRGFKSHHDFLKDANAVIDERVNVYNYLKDRYDPEVFIFTFTCTDRVQHRMFKHMNLGKGNLDPSARELQELLCDFWRHLDEAVGELIKTCDEDTTIIVISDHGFGLQSEIFYVNQWLHQKEYLKFRQSGDQPKATNFLSRKMRKTVRNVIKHLPARRMLRHSAPESLKRAFRADFSFESMLEKIDWSQTRAYSPRHTSVFGNIYLNIQGREREGSVSLHCYDELREQIIGDLRSLEDEIADFQIQVFRREELYRGGYIEQAPDIIYAINNFRCVSRSFSRNETVFQTKALNDDYGGTHRLEGIFIARGPHIRQNHYLEQAQIMDVAPTILHILGIPIPNDMDGEVLRDIFSPDSDLATAEVSLVKLEHNQAAHRPDSLLDEKVMKRLRDLGYL